MEYINSNLESILQETYRSWFVNFDDYADKNDFLDDFTFGLIPKDCEVVYLKDFVDFVTGVEPGSKNYYQIQEKDMIPFYRVGDLGSRDNLVYIKEEDSKNKLVAYNDIVISLDATLGIVKMGLDGAYSTGMRKLVIKDDIINKPFLYCLMKSQYIQNIILNYATGTTILHAGKSINYMKFVLSSREKLEAFNRIGEPILNEIIQNIKEITNLEKLRDTLLPKLMSGEVDVSEIKIG